MVTAQRTRIAVLLALVAIAGVLLWLAFDHGVPSPWSHKASDVVGETKGRKSTVDQGVEPTLTSSTSSTSTVPPAETRPVQPTAEPGAPVGPTKSPVVPPAIGEPVRSVPVADVVAQFVRERMTQASVAFVAPDELGRNEAGVALLRLAPTTIPPSELQRELQAMLGRAGHGDAATILIAPRMVATLTSDQPCAIELRNPPADRAVAFGERTTWEWTVRPTRESGASIELSVALAAPVVVDGRETIYSIGIYRRRLAVRVGYREQAADMLAWLGSSWATLAALVTSVGAAFTWLFRRRRSKAHRAGF